MNEEQLKLFIRHAFSLENSAQSAVKRADPGFARAMAGIRNIVGALPDQSLMREQEWQAMLGQVAAELEPYNQAFAESVVEEMVGATPEMQRTASDMISRAGVQVPPGTGIPVQDSVRLALNSKVNSTRLSTLFNTDGGAGMSPWIRDNMRVIDRTVKSGIFQGKPTKDIADEIAVAMVRNGQEVLNFNGPTAARQIRAQANAIARTAVQDMNRQVKEVVWKENAQIIAVGDLRIEWVAALDSRTCPTCGPLDGTRHKKQSSFPASPPIHVNCRCQLVLVDPDDPAAIRTGQQVSVEQSTGEGAYKTKVKVKGDKLYRKAKNVQLGPDGQRSRYADYLAQSNRKTQQMFFGGGNAGSIRAQRFDDLVKAGYSPEKALQQLVVGDPAKRGFVPVDKLPPVSKPAPKKKATATPTYTEAEKARIREETNARLRARAAAREAAAAPPKPPASAPKPKTAPASKVAAPVSTKKPKAATSRQTDVDFAKSHNFMDPSAKLSADKVADSLQQMTSGKTLADQHMRELLQFQREKNLSVIWSNGREKSFGPSMDYFKKSPAFIESLEDAAKRGGKAAHLGADIAKDLRAGQSTTFLGRLAVVNKGAAGHTADGFGAIVIKRGSHQAVIKAADIDRYRSAIRLAVTDAGDGAPQFVTDRYLFNKTASGAWVNKFDWLTTYTHEMGHQVHYAAGQPSLPAGVKWTPSKYGATNADEQFAETFVQYVHAPEQLKKANPAAYEWVSKALKKALK